MKKLIILLVALVSLTTAYCQTAEDYFDLGVSKAKLKDYRGAIADYNKAIDIEPNYIMLSKVTDGKNYIWHFRSAYSKRGNSKYYLEDYRGAIADFNKAIRIDSRNEEAYYYRGRSKTKLEDLRGAMADFNKAIDIDPKYAKAYYYRGATKFVLYQKDSGCLDFSKAGELGLGQAYDIIKEHCN